jgi:tetratricopeptide (TPR) repeat protein
MRTGLGAKLAEVVGGLLFAGLMILPEAHAGACPDTVFLKPDHRPVKGEVVKETVDRVVLVDERNNRIEFRWERISKVQFGLQNPAWDTAVQEFERRNYESAALHFKAALEDPSLRAVAQPCLYRMLAIGLSQAGLDDEAGRYFEKLLTDHPLSSYAPESADALVELYLDSEQFGKVRALAKQLALAGPHYAVRAVLYEAEADLVVAKANLAAARADTLEAKKAEAKMAEVKARFTKAISAGPSPELLARARAGQAASEAQPSAARQAAEQALNTRGASPRAQAKAHLIIGGALRAEAAALTGDAAADRYLDAVLEYLRVALLHGQDKHLAGEALFRAGECFRALARLPGRRSNRARAAELFNQVRTQYPGTRWASAAADTLRGM